MIKIALVEKQNLLREAMVSRLNQVKLFKIVFDTPNEEELVSLLVCKPVNLLVIHPDTSDKATLNICKQALKTHPNLKILLITKTFNDATVAKALKIGVAGFLNKNFSGQQLEDAIVAVQKSGFYFEQEHLDYIKTSIPVKPKSKSKNNVLEEPLTKTEKKVLTQSAFGFTIKEIGLLHYVSSNTIKSHRGSILKKTGCRNITEALVFAIKHKIIKAKKVGLKGILGCWLLLSMSFSFMEGIGCNEVDSDSEVMEICWGME